MAKIRLNAQYQNGQAYIRLVYRYRIGAKQIKFVYSTGRQVAAGQSIRPIMEIGGWSKESTFLGYVKASRLVSAVSYVKGRAG